jgi:hypothetical protein
MPWLRLAASGSMQRLLLLLQPKQLASAAAARSCPTLVPRDCAELTHCACQGLTQLSGLDDPVFNMPGHSGPGWLAGHFTWTTQSLWRMQHMDQQYMTVMRVYVWRCMEVCMAVHADEAICVSWSTKSVPHCSCAAHTCRVAAMRLFCSC